MARRATTTGFVMVKDIPFRQPSGAGDHWGAWQYRADVQVLDYRRRESDSRQWTYEINLDRAKTPEQCADWLAHLSEKRWITTADLGHLVRAFTALGRLR